ncbi:MAG: hypothetical protein EU548_06760 [Promethearchaeota archaeon]|nr:MAG: hypothetical protein EU548_06760 [Candidatus Lokiarchaeota archaeon]
MTILTLDELVNGTLSLICVIIAIIIGIRIMLKYFQTKQPMFLYVGLTWIGIFTPWFSSAIAFLTALILMTPINPTIYFIISGSGAVLIVYLWMSAFCFLTNKKKALIWIVTIETAVIEAIYLIFVFINISLVGSLQSLVDAKYELIGALLFINLMLIYISTATIFAFESIRSYDKTIKLKGIFILAASYMFIISALLDTVFDLGIIALTIVRILLMVSGILFYFGFMPPKILQKLILKE